MPDEEAQNRVPVFGTIKKFVKLRTLLPPPLPFEQGEGQIYYFTTKNSTICEASFSRNLIEEDGCVHLTNSYTFHLKLLDNPNDFKYDEDVIATINAIIHQFTKQIRFGGYLTVPHFLSDYTDDESKIEVWEEWRTMDGVPFHKIIPGGELMWDEEDE